MNRWQLFRITLLLAVIFAGGFAAGRFSAPTAPIRLTGVSGRAWSTDELLARLAKQYELDAAQQQQFQPIVQEAVRQMAQLPSPAPERTRVYRDCMARLRPLLRPDQRPAFDRQVERTLRAYERAQRAGDPNHTNPGSGIHPPAE